ncbi:peptide deformylase 1 [Catellatospora citrea]|uniref:Peptide deformylase n=1 Tax=Catellatospora citrea TaxID=53366 RepID=A0A8J3P476_9ACTN|nr:peptide deformylase 1 [Catellatospora citrea]
MQKVTVKPIRLVGDPVLRQPARPVETFDAELGRLVKDLRQTLAASKGAGLAAPQIGVGLRVFAIHPSLSDGKLDHLVNPSVTFLDEDEQDGLEGCLSIPGIYLDTKRRLNVVATGFNSHGDPVQIVGSGLLSRCIQHETDHLDGVLFLDRQDASRQQRLLAALRAASWFDDGAPAEPIIKVSPH